MKNIRIGVAGFILRLYDNRKDAVNAANARTRLTQQQHREKRYGKGYLVENVVEKKLYNDDGEVPEAAAKQIYAR